MYVSCTPTWRGGGGGGGALSEWLIRKLLAFRYDMFTISVNEYIERFVLS